VSFDIKSLLKWDLLSGLGSHPPDSAKEAEGIPDMWKIETLRLNGLFC
jgi:hypothetical protein